MLNIIDVLKEVFSYSERAQMALHNGSNITLCPCIILCPVTLVCITLCSAVSQLFTELCNKSINLCHSVPSGLPIVCSLYVSIQSTCFVVVEHVLSCVMY